MPDAVRTAAHLFELLVIGWYRITIKTSATTLLSIMKQLLIIPVLCLALAAQLSGQAEIFDGLFGKEEPTFHASFTPTAEEGVVKMSFHFTHPSLDKLEVSFWAKDLGANLMGNGEKRLVQGLGEYGNRQQAEILIDNLKSRHFYTIGIDYRGGSTISRKFSSRVLEESYRYEYQAPAPVQARAAEPPARQPKSPIAAPAPQPCQPPSLFVQVEPAGYCGADNRPAILLQCTNCQGRPWEFSVEARSEFEQWQPLRIDGKRQQALGVAPRTEPLCTLEPGAYYFRVLAWGENCDSPAVQTIGTSVQIAGDEPASALYPTPSLPQPTASVPAYLPDTCIIESEAILEGDLISGFIELDPASPCSAYQPFAKVRYVHPGYRDITVGQVTLVPGEDAAFKVRLDKQDLSRGIHPLQITVCIRPKDSSKDIPISSFWIRAEAVAGSPAPEPTRQKSGFQEEDHLAKWQEAQGIASGSEQEEWGFDKGARPPGLPGFSAAGPDCSELGGLQLIYVPDRPGQPLYISWSNPGCCQEQECEYSVWAGPGPDQLKLLAKGRKSGATIRESILNAEKGTAYYEVAVRTPAGVRKAAYISGRGPKYGAEKVSAHQNQYEPSFNEPLVATQEAGAAPGIQLGGGLAARAGGPAPSFSGAPQRPITDFAPCRIFRETHVIANKPIQDGDRVTIEYDFNDRAYLYSLYHQPDGSPDWVIAPGTTEFQQSPSFEIQARAHHSGKYLVLAIKKDKSWGCLSAPVSEPLEIQVLR